MNLRDLEYLVAVAETRHFRKAAEATNVSQPTLSGQIRKVEEYLGIALFERDSRNVVLTAAGEAVVGEARAALAHAAAIKDIANAHRDPLAGRFKLGIIASLGPFLTADLLTQIRHDAPRLDIVLHEGLTDELIALIRARDLDAALIATEPDADDLIEIPAFDEPFLVAHAPDNPLSAKEALTLDDIDGETLLLLAEGHCLRDQALSLCGAKSVDARVRATSLLTLMGLVAQGYGTTLVPALAARFAPGLALRPLSDVTASRSVRLVGRRNYPRRGALEVVAGAARAVAAARGVHGA